jgi:DNA-binding IscR family transcriptional regulator
MNNTNQTLSGIMAMLKQGNLAEKKVMTLKEASIFTGLSKSKLYKLTSNLNQGSDINILLLI